MAIDYYKLYKDPRYFSLPKDVKDALDKGDITLDDIGFVDLDTAPEPQQEDPGFWDKTVAAGRAFGQEAIGGAAQTIGGTVATVGETLGLAFDPVGTMLEAVETGKPAIRSPMLSEEGRIFADTGRGEEARRIREQAGIPEDSLVASATRGGASAFPLLAGMATMNPTAGALVMGGSVFGPEFIQSTDEMGLSKVEAAKRAATQTLIETLTERVGMGALMKGGLDNILTKGLRDALEKNYGTKVAGAIFANMAEELTAAEAQMAADEIGGYKTYTPEEKARARQDAVVAGGLMGGAVRAVTAPFDPVVEDAKVTASRLSEQADKQVSDLLGQQKAVRDKEFSDAFDERITREQMIAADRLANANQAQDLFSGELTTVPTEEERQSRAEQSRTEERQAELEREYGFQQMERGLQRRDVPAKDVATTGVEKQVEQAVREGRSPTMATAFEQAGLRRQTGMLPPEALTPEQAKERASLVSKIESARTQLEKENEAVPQRVDQKETKLVEELDQAYQSNDDIRIAKAEKALDDFYKNSKAAGNRSGTREMLANLESQLQDFDRKASEAYDVQNMYPGIRGSQQPAPLQPIGKAQPDLPLGYSGSPDAIRIQDIQGPALQPKETTSPRQSTPVPEQPQMPPVEPPTQFEEDLDQQASPEEVEALRTEIDMEVERTQREQRVRETLANRQIEGVDVYFDPTVREDGTVQFGRFNPETGRTEINAAQLEDDADIVAVSVHEIAHNLNQARDEGTQVSRRDLRSVIGADNAPVVNSRIQSLAQSSPIFKRAVERANASNNPEAEMLSYALEEINRAREAKQPLGRRVTQFVKDTVATIKGGLARAGFVDLSKSFNENDLYRLGKVMTSEYGKGLRAKGRQGAGATLESFGGVRAKNAPLQDYARAEELEIAGATPRQIWNETGWRRGVDDKWRFEIDDSRAKLTQEWDSLQPADQSVRRQKPLEKVLDHDGILKNYPELQKLPVLKEKMKDREKGYFMPGLDGKPGYIAINASLPQKEALSVLLHEAQHAIQMVENFANGGSVESVWKNMSSDEKATSKEHAKKFLEDRRLENKKKLDGLRKKDQGSLSRTEKAMLNSLPKKILKDTNDLRSLSAGDDAVLKNALKEGNFLYDAYMRIAGEAEARNVQARQQLTEGERREIGVEVTQDIPDEQLTIGGKPARGEQQRSEVLESRAAPAKKEKKVTGKEQQKTERVEPEDSIDRLSTRAFENVPGSGKAPKKTVKTTASRVEKALRYSNKAIANMLGSLGGRNVEIVEILESQKGSSAEALFDAVQSENRLNKAVFKFKDKGKRGEVLRNLAQASSETKADRDAAREWLKTNAPSVYTEYTRARNSIRFLGIQIAQNILYSGRPLTKREVAVIKAIQRNAENYLNRSYKAYARSGVVRQKWRKYIMDGVEKAKKTGEPNEAANIYEGAVEATKRNYLDISNLLETTKEDAAGFRTMGIEEIKALADVWLGHDAPPLNAEMTSEQRDAFIEDVSQRLNEKWKELQANGTYAQKLNSKAEESVQKLIGVIRDGDSAFSKMIRGVTVDRTIITKKQFVPEEIRKVLGEIVNPMSQIANTRMLMAEFVAAQKAMSSLYDIGTANKWVVPPDQSDADTYTSKFPDDREKYGNLAGMASTEDFHKAVVTVSEMNASIRDAILYGDRPEEAVVDMLKDKWAGLTSMTKMMSVAYNAMNPIFNFGGGAIFTPIMNGYAVASPGKQNREALAFAAKAVFSSLATDKREAMTKEFRTILRSGLQDAIEVQELQEGARRELRDELLDSISKDITEDKKPIREFLKNSISFAAKKLPVWATAESDRVWVYYAFKREEQMLADYYKAKEMEIPPEELRMQAAARIKQANINPQRSGKLIKGLERSGLTQYMNYFAETYKTIGRSQWLALKDMQQAMKDARDGNTAAARIIGQQGLARLLGTSATVFANQAMMIGIREAAKAAGLLMVLGTAFSDDDEEQETIEALKKMMPLDEQGKTWMVIGQKGNTYYLQDANRFDPLEPASAPLQSLADGNFERAYEQAKSVVFQNALLTNVINAFVQGDKKAPMAYSHPAVYDKIMRGTEETIRALGADDPQLAKDIVNGALKPVRVLTPRFTWDWMNRWIAEDSPEQDIEGNSALIGAIRKSGGYVMEADPRRMLSRAVYNSTEGNGFKQVRDQLRKDLTSVLTENPDNIVKVVGAKMAQEAEAFKKLRNVYEGASTLYGEDKVDELNTFLKDQISDNRVYNAVVDGEFRSTLLSKKVIDGLIQFIDSKDIKPEEKEKQKEQLQRIYEVYAEDPQAAPETRKKPRATFY